MGTMATTKKDTSTKAQPEVEQDGTTAVTRPADDAPATPKEPEGSEPGQEPETKPQDKATKHYRFNEYTILEYLGATSDEMLAESIRKVGSAGFTAGQLLQTLRQLKETNVAKENFGGSTERCKKLREFISSLYLRQVTYNEEKDLLNVGPLYVENSVGGNAALGIGVRTESDGIVRKSGFGFYIRADHLRNSGVRLKAQA